MQSPSSMGVATVRTALPAAWTVVVLWIATKFGLSITSDDLLVLAPIAGVVTGIVYRLARELEARFPTLGRIFLGSSKTPTYEG